MVWTKSIRRSTGEKFLPFGTVKIAIGAKHADMMQGKSGYDEAVTCMQPFFPFKCLMKDNYRRKRRRRNDITEMMECHWKSKWNRSWHHIEAAVSPKHYISVYFSRITGQTLVFHITTTFTQYFPQSLVQRTAYPNRFAKSKKHKPINAKLKDMLLFLCNT